MLHQEGSIGEQRDGMDISICSIDFENMELQYSGANSPLYIIRSNDKEPVDETIVLEYNNHVLYELKGDKMPIALYEKMGQFKSFDIKILKGDFLYLFSDGFTNQFGGADGKRFKNKPFKEILLSNCTKSMEEQKLLLNSTFVSWKKDYEQIDDVMVLGISV